MGGAALISAALQLHPFFLYGRGVARGEKKNAFHDPAPAGLGVEDGGRGRLVDLARARAHSLSTTLHSLRVYLRTPLLSPCLLRLPCSLRVYLRSQDPLLSPCPCLIKFNNV